VLQAVLLTGYLSCSVLQILSQAALINIAATREADRSFDPPMATHMDRNPAQGNSKSCPLGLVAVSQLPRFCQPGFRGSIDRAR
jgi:hypothetical protein